MAKWFLLFGLLAVFMVNAAQAEEVDKEFRLRIHRAEDWMFALFKKFEQTPIREWSINTNAGPNKRYTAVLRNISIRGLSGGVAKSIVYDPKLVVNNFLCEVPKVTITGQYEANGIIGGKQLTGAGNVQITISKIGVIAKLKLSEKGIATNIDVSYTIGNIDVKADGLKLQGSWFPNKEVSKLILEDARKDIPRLAKVFTKVAKAASDSYIAGLGLSQTMDKAMSAFSSS